MVSVKDYLSNRVYDGIRPMKTPYHPTVDEQKHLAELILAKRPVDAIKSLHGENKLSLRDAKMWMEAFAAGMALK
jgi:hypothetical protein